MHAPSKRFTNIATVYGNITVPERYDHPVAKVTVVREMKGYTLSTSVGIMLGKEVQTIC